MPSGVIFPTLFKGDRMKKMFPAGSVVTAVTLFRNAAVAGTLEVVMPRLLLPPTVEITRGGGEVIT